jgi:hypothetical protein
MEDYGLSAYVEQMNYVALRMAVLRNFINFMIKTTSDFTTIEFQILQIRKIIEHIALGSLIANKDLYCDFYKKFETCWNARLIFRDLERINPRFYPEPIKVDKSITPNNFIPVSEKYMTKEEALVVYEKCGSILHATNPYGSQPDISLYKDNIPKWYQDLLVLTDNHLIHMVGGNHIFYVIMRSAQTGKPAGNLFQRTSSL